MYVCMHACMYVCLYVCIYVNINKYVHIYKKYVKYSWTTLSNSITKHSGFCLCVHFGSPVAWTRALAGRRKADWQMPVWKVSGLIRG